MNAMRKIFLTGLGVLLITLVPAQNKEQVLTVMFYNVENLFDTERNPDKLDSEFTPESEKAWDLERYEKKHIIFLGLDHRLLWQLTRTLAHLEDQIVVDCVKDPSAAKEICDREVVHVIVVDGWEQAWQAAHHLAGDKLVVTPAVDRKRFNSLQFGRANQKNPTRPLHRRHGQAQPPLDAFDEFVGADCDVRLGQQQIGRFDRK